MGLSQLPCRQCGAKLEFDPAASALKCPYCGAENQVPRTGEAVQELDFRAYLTGQRDEGETEERLTVKCAACGAETTLNPHIEADLCPFCGAAIVATGVSRRLIKPKSLLPFHVTREQALAQYKAWVASLWFAPGELKRHADTDGRFTGMYIPYWTYDCRTISDYTGERGEDYWETEHYTTHENGRTVHRTRQVRRTRWYPASGTVRNRFDDLLVAASRSLPSAYVEKLEPWDLGNLTPYRAEFLSGFRAENYQVDLVEGFGAAREMMQPEIESTICSDIGGDHQRIDSVDTRYLDITFKHLLLPMWICAYRYRDATFRVLVNARTGEVQGERPWSAAKIILCVLAAVAAVAAIAIAVASSQR